MKLFTYFLLFIIGLNSALNAQVNSKIPDWVKVIDIKDIGSVNKNQIKDGYHYVLIDEQYNTIKNQNYFHYVTSVISEEALIDVSQIELSYDPSYEKAILHFVKIYRGGTVIDKTKNIDLKKLNEEKRRKNGVLSGKETLYANLSDVRKGDIIEYAYSINGKNPIMGNYFNYNFSLSYSVPIGKIHLRLLFPKEISPTIVYHNTKQKPLITQTLFNDYLWEINNPKINTTESSIPYWFSPYANVQISNLKNWKEVKDHCRKLYKLPIYNNSGLKVIVDSIVKSSGNLESQISSIVEFVQMQIRYSGNENGIYSHVPRTPDFVLKNRYGDCKEKSGLLNELLKLINVEAYSVLVNTSLGFKVQDEVPSLNAFDHCISSFSFKEKLYFIDPTISYQRGDFKFKVIPDYESGMILNENEKAFTVIPTDVSSKCEVSEEFVIDDFGNAKLRAVSKYTGSHADEIRYYYLTNSIDDIQDNYKAFYNKYSDDIIIIDTVSFEDNSKKNEITTVEYYLLKDFWTIKDSTISKSIYKDFMPYSLNSKLNYGDEKIRKNPLRILYPCNHTQTITIIKDGGFNLENELRKEENRFFNYSYTTKITDSKLELIYNFKSKTGIIDPVNYKDYKLKMDFINSNMVFSAEEKPNAVGIDGFNWILFLTILVALILSIICVCYFYNMTYSQEFETKYDSIGGWLIILGIGITANPIALLYGIYSQYYDEMFVNYYVFYFDSNSFNYSPTFGYFNILVCFFNIILFVFSILLVVLFYQKKNSFRLSFVIFRLFNVLFLIVNVIVFYFLYNNSELINEQKTLSDETISMIRIVAQSCIWVPYVWFSERSKHTFTNGNNTK